MTQPFLTDRSRIIAHQTCNRLRYYQYEWNGVGLSPVRSSIPLTVGKCTHAGLEILLTAVLKADQKGIQRDAKWLEGFVDLAVEKALSDYDFDCRERSLELSESDDASYVYMEQRALIEAMIRGWCVARLPSFLEEYEVVEVEREELLTLVEPSMCPMCNGKGEVRFNITYVGIAETCTGCNGQGKVGGILFMARADGLLRNRRDNNLYILSFKTAAKYDERTARDNRYDMQGMSELAAIESRLEREHELFSQQAHAVGSVPGPAPKIMGVQMEYLLKGERSKEYIDGSYSGPYRQNSPLIRPYMKQGILSSGDAFAHRYQWVDEMSGNTRRLGKGWARVNIWEVMPVKEWIEMLAANEVQPEAGDALTVQFVSPPPIYRNEDDVRSFLTQVTAQEKRIAAAREWVAGAQSEEERTRLLDENFPQYRRACVYYGAPCAYVPLCHEGLASSPLTTGLYSIRRPHHLREKERFENEKT